VPWGASRRGGKATQGCSVSVDGLVCGAARAQRSVCLREVRTHNLKGFDVEIPHRRLTLITGVSGSGKSSLAFDTLYAEGQRRFLESMSTYARNFLQQMEKPPVREVVGILPAIALRQRSTSSHARSTVATLTELSEHLQMLFAHLGEQRCVVCGSEVQADTVPGIVGELLGLGAGVRLVLVAELEVQEGEETRHLLGRLAEQGFRRFWRDGEVVAFEDVDIESLLGWRTFPVLIDRVVVDGEKVSRLVEAVEQGLEMGGGRLDVFEVGGADGWVHRRYDRRFSCRKCGEVHTALVPALFSPNTTLGACAVCTGFGKTAGIDPGKVVPDGTKSLREGAIAPFASAGKAVRRRQLFAFCEKEGVPLDVPWRELSQGQQALIFKGRGRYRGVQGFFADLEKKRQKVSARVMLARYRGYSPCESCGGARLSAQAREVLVGGQRLASLYGMQVKDALLWFRAFADATENAGHVSVLLEEIISRLRYLDAVGLGYLRLERQTRTLSGGELQRLHLTSSLGRALTDTLYVLDEPTAGLHARDTQRLLGALLGLRDLGNTVVVVEHDLELIGQADHVIELGPVGGEGGGELLFCGAVAALMASESPTGRALRLTDAAASEVAREWRGSGSLWIRGAFAHNLKGIDVEIPLGGLVCVSGVSGSGKSTLVHHVLYNHWQAAQGEEAESGGCRGVDGLDALSEIILMDQRSLGRSSRSNAATYTKAWDGIRALMAKSKDAQDSGITPAHFSFNVAAGRCERCEGSGKILVELQFLADLELLCDLCQGRRFTEPVLAVRHQEKNIADILDMTVREGLVFFRGERAIVRKLQPLADVGLGYLRLGQSTSTLSGGEMQRLRLASFMAEARRVMAGQGKRLFIFDEPTVGLHFQDVEVLVGALRRLISAGASVLVVEHNTDFLLAADHIIDLGPEAGEGGGEVVIAGSPVEVAQCDRSYTGRALRQRLMARECQE